MRNHLPRNRWEVLFGLAVLALFAVTGCSRAHAQGYVHHHFSVTFEPYYKFGHTSAKIINVPEGFPMGSLEGPEVVISKDYITEPEAIAKAKRDAASCRPIFVGGRAEPQDGCR